MYILSVDPGNNAAVAVLAIDERSIKPRILDLFSVAIWRKELGYASSALLQLKLLSSFKMDLIVIEKVRSMPNQGIASTSKFMLSTGVIKGALEAIYRQEVIEISPVTWKMALGVTKDKKTSLKLARKIFGGARFPLVKDHDKAEACLIGLFAGGWRP